MLSDTYLKSIAWSQEGNLRYDNLDKVLNIHGFNGNQVLIRLYMKIVESAGADRESSLRNVSSNINTHCELECLLLSLSFLSRGPVNLINLILPVKIIQGVNAG